ncbi:MAG: FAD-dependent oxidoreductase [Victivallales bacterium]|jgi:hypothetical protein
MKYIVEKEKKTPVMFETDVVVCGGGTAGLAAAVCAARRGLSVVIVERTSIPGGMVTHVTCWTSDFDNKGGFTREFIGKLRNDGIEVKPYYNPWRIVPYFDSLITENNISVLYLSTVVAPIIEDGKLSGVIVESKSGRTAIKAEIVIDATGDGDIAASAGAAFRQGREGDGAVQAISLTQMLTNYTSGQIKRERMREIIEEAVAKSGKQYWYPYANWHPETAVGTERTLLHTVAHATGYDPTDAVQLSCALVEMRKQAYELFDLLKNNTEEFRNIEFGPFSAIPGVRESRRIVCDRMVTKEDIYSGARFDDGLFTVAQAVDIHRRDRDEAPIIVKKTMPYHIPYAAFLPAGLENILVVGRCIGGDHESVASYRIIADCMAMGESAAIAADFAIKGNCPLRKINVGELVKEMSSLGYVR